MSTCVTLLGGAAKNATSLNTLPEDVQILILRKLAVTSFSDILNFGQSTRAMRKIALTRIYRDVRLATGPEGSKRETAYQALIDIIRLDDRCEVVRHVRNVAVQNEIPSGDLVLVLEKTAGLGTLQSLTWNTLTPISDLVFHKLHTTWSALSLSVSILDRRDGTAEIDHQEISRLIASPMLKDFTYAFYGRIAQHHALQSPGWSTSIEALEASGNLRALCLSNEREKTKPQSSFGTTETGEAFCLNLMPDTRQSMIETFRSQCERLGGGFIYHVDARHGHVLRESINCTDIRSLDFGEDNPETFFTSFKNALPGLKSLRFGACGGSRARSPAADFIESVDALESLTIAHTACAIHELAPAIVKHKDTLRTLDLSSNFHAWYCIACIDRSSAPLFYGEDVIMRLTRQRKPRRYRP